jgi:hypothetical protein
LPTCIVLGWAPKKAPYCEDEWTSLNESQNSELFCGPAAQVSLGRYVHRSTYYFSSRSLLIQVALRAFLRAFQSELIGGQLGLSLLVLAQAKLTCLMTPRRPFQTVRSPMRAHTDANFARPRTNSAVPQIAPANTVRECFLSGFQKTCSDRFVSVVCFVFRLEAYTSDRVLRGTRVLFRPPLTSSHQ